VCCVPCPFILQATIRDFFQCDNWNPIYEYGAYEAVCYDGTEGFVWATSCQIVIVFLTFIIWTLRAAIYEADAPPPEKKNVPTGSPNPFCCCYNSNELENYKNSGSTDRNEMDGTNTASNNTNKSKIELEAELEAMAEPDEERLLERDMPRSSSGV
jgi:hypothetical protein